MFRDRSEELRRLEEALLEEEEEQVEEQEADDDLLADDLLDEWLLVTAPAKEPGAYQNYSNDYGQEEDLLEEEYLPLVKKKDNFAFVIVLCLLLMVGLCALVIWLLHRGGIL